LDTISKLKIYLIYKIKYLYILNKMSLVNLIDTDIFVRKLIFADGTSQTEGVNPTTLDYYDIPSASPLPQGVWNIAQTTDPFAVGVYMVHYKVQVFTPNNDAMNVIQIECVDNTTALEINGSIFIWDNTISVSTNSIRSIDKTGTFLWNNLTAGNTFTLQTWVEGTYGGAGFTYQLAEGAVIQLIKIG
jgi:hypothetical protein